MNKELIDGFIKQAAGLEQTTIPIDNFAFHVQDFEKFAELIVKECLDILDDENGDIDYCKHLIRNKFGVE